MGRKLSAMTDVLVHHVLCLSLWIIEIPVFTASEVAFSRRPDACCYGGGGGALLSFDARFRALGPLQDRALHRILHVGPSPVPLLLEAQPSCLHLCGCDGGFCGTHWGIRGRTYRSARAMQAQCNYLGVWPY